MSSANTSRALCICTIRIVIRIVVVVVHVIFGRRHHCGAVRLGSPIGRTGGIATSGFPEGTRNGRRARHGVRAARATQQTRADTTRRRGTRARGTTRRRHLVERRAQVRAQHRRTQIPERRNGVLSQLHTHRRRTLNERRRRVETTKARSGTRVPRCRRQEIQSSHGVKRGADVRARLGE